VLTAEVWRREGAIPNVGAFFENHGSIKIDEIPGGLAEADVIKDA
jgi:hypothetical protein